MCSLGVVVFAAEVLMLIWVGYKNISEENISTIKTLILVNFLAYAIMAMTILRFKKQPGCTFLVYYAVKTLLMFASIGLHIFSVILYLELYDKEDEEIKLKVASGLYILGVIIQICHTGLSFSTCIKSFKNNCSVATSAENGNPHDVIEE